MQALDFQDVQKYKSPSMFWISHITLITNIFGNMAGFTFIREKIFRYTQKTHTYQQK